MSSACREARRTGPHEYYLAIHRSMCARPYAPEVDPPRNRVPSTAGPEASSRGVVSPRAGLAGPPSPRHLRPTARAPDRGAPSSPPTGFVQWAA